MPDITLTRESSLNDLMTAIDNTDNSPQLKEGIKRIFRNWEGYYKYRTVADVVNDTNLVGLDRGQTSISLIELYHFLAESGFTPKWYARGARPVAVTLTDDSSIDDLNMAIQQYRGDEKPLPGQTLLMNRLDSSRYPFHATVGELVADPRTGSYLRTISSVADVSVKFLHGFLCEKGFKPAWPPKEVAFKPASKTEIISSLKPDSPAQLFIDLVALNRTISTQDTQQLAKALNQQECYTVADILRMPVGRALSLDVKPQMQEAFSKLVVQINQALAPSHQQIYGASR